ncbi:hypothetical protein NP493_160g00032 [Ridgeia piscesae]|uniref:GATA-type domain-containing protein n=1 Tax=Ridgeia piscesae TaxID=27915 RepID=A0AAD9P3S0_RIDPI|nr:hypothetical protein NP493_160g00032 [Ridgeia piscesae]
MATLQNVIAAVYNFVQLSPKRLTRFKEIAAVLSMNTVKFQRLYEIRWLSLGNSVTALLRNYEAFMVVVEEDAASGDPTAMGLQKQLSAYTIVALLHLTADILATTDHLSRLFQQRDVSFCGVQAAVTGCLETLEGMQNQDGPYLSMLEAALVCTPAEYKGVSVTFKAQRGGTDAKEAFHTVRVQLLESLPNNLKQRFPHIALLDAMQIFEPCAYPESASHLTYWGNNYLETLLAHYGERQHNTEGKAFDAVIDKACCRGECLPFKRIVHDLRRCEEDGLQRFRHTTEVIRDPGTPSGRQCASCNTRRTALWRGAEDGTPLCNACGIRYRKYRIRCKHCWLVPTRGSQGSANCTRCGLPVK